ncbi:MAG: hypothetical protein E7293_02580 [Lachnospiraceae bacterium]|nr:hypothetical protein [Lachnospiraceae bacterium]
MIRHKAFWAGLILLITGILSFVYWSSQKQIWFTDEIYSYESSNGFEQDWPSSQIGQWMTGSDIEAYLSADSDHLSFDAISDRLYSDHVPLYFWLFRLVSFLFFPGSGSIWIGLVINLFFYLFVLVLGYGFFLRLTSSPLLSATVMFFTAVVNRLMLQQATILRMYMLLLWAMLLLLMGGLWVLQDCKRPKMSPVLFIYLYIISVIGLLTHYDFWIFYAITAALFCLWLLILAVRKGRLRFWTTGEFKYVLAWVGNFAASLLTTIFLFPYCRWNLNRGKGETALKSIFDFSAKKLQDIGWGYERLSACLFGEKFPPILGLLLIFGCILDGAVLLYKRKEMQKLTGLILTVLTAQAYQFVVCFTFPADREERYLWCVYTILLFCMAWGAILLLQALLSLVKDAAVRKMAGRITYAILAIGILAAEWLVIDSGKGIEYLSHPAKDMSVLQAHSDIPWVVYGQVTGAHSYYDWTLPEQICFLTLEDTPEDLAAVKELRDTDSFLVYIPGDYRDQAVTYFQEELGRKFDSQFLTNSIKYNVYLMSATK